jgi:hypothetical protein
VGATREIKRILTLKCEESSFLMSESLDRELGRGEAIALAIHRLICRSCRRFKMQLRVLRQVTLNVAALNDTVFGQPLRLSAEKRAAIQTALRRLADGEQA